MGNKSSSRHRRWFIGLLMFFFVVGLVGITARNVLGTEGGGSHYPGGNEDFMVGALPPAGSYFMNYVMYYTANRMKDNGGSTVPGDFSLDATVEAMRLIHVTKTKLFGADMGMHIIVPVTYQHVSVGGPSQSKTGLGDIEFSPFVLGWHFNKNWHLTTCVDFMVPTGAYDKDDLSNTGRNYWTFNPVVAFTYLHDNGFEVSAKILYLINTVNSATGYTSGQEFIVDYLVGQHIGNWSIGVNGAYYKQITDDSVRNEPASFDGYKGQFFSIGPAIQYNYKNMFFSIKYQTDTNVKNKPEGEKFWFKFFYAF
ncbi:MAG: transporter [Syntrophorhabdaceae bacterium]|nr:transporter [Syntrophorhabdaceae bacterium]